MFAIFFSGGPICDFSNIPQTSWSSYPGSIKLTDRDGKTTVITEYGCENLFFGDHSFHSCKFAKIS